MSPQIRDSLRHSTLFAQLSDSAADAVLAHSRVVCYLAGAQIFVKGDPGDSMMIVLSGRVSISTPSPDGRQIVLSTLGHGEIFGEMAILDGRERTADAVSAIVSQILVVPRRTFVPLLEGRADLCLHLIRVLCKRLRQTNGQVEDLAFLDLDVRLAQALLRLEHVNGTVKISQRCLGELVGGSRARINRHLSAWRAQGYVTVRGGEITILNRAALGRQGAE